MENKILIPEKGGNGNSAMIKDNGKEVGEVNSMLDCNMYLKAGWGLLTVVPKQYYDEDRGVMVHGIAYIVYRTIT